MPLPAPLLPSKIYHIYSHANGDENIFRRQENYHYFLAKYSEHIHPIAETFAYCLLPNHFHLMVRIRDKETLLNSFPNLSGLLSKKFSNFLNAYSKAYNKMFDRRGSLFERPFKRKSVDSDRYYTALIAYIHNNPIHHEFVRDLNDWPHSSWHSYLLDRPTKLCRKEGLEWFGGKQEFRRFHRELEKKDVIIDFEF